MLLPKIIDPQTIPVADLPGVWTPGPKMMTPEDRVNAVEAQAQTALLWTIDHPETLLRLLLGETAITRTHEPPRGYDAELQGEWDHDAVAYKFKREMHVTSIEREPDYLYVEYEVKEIGRWSIEISPEEVNISRIS